MEIREVSGTAGELLSDMLDLPADFGRTADEILLGGFDELGRLQTGVGIVRPSSPYLRKAPCASLFVTPRPDLEPASALSLIEAVVRELGPLGYDAAQVISYSSEWDQAFAASGFQPLRDALTLVASTSSSLASSPSPTESVQGASESVLCRVPALRDGGLVKLVAQTYEGAEDTWVSYIGQNADDHFAQLKQQSEPDSFWFVIRDRDRDAGVMLFGKNQRDSAVLLYFGLIASARGRGLARRALGEALAIWGQKRVESVLVQVAADNDAAIRAYLSQGFVELRRGTLFVRSVPD